MANQFCFVMMPVSTPQRLVETYSNDQEHFFHILEHLIIPSLELAGFEPLLPTVNGSVVIHSEIIRRLCVAEMALADISSLNANVFFEMGIRTALNRPVAIIKDDKTATVPFDTQIINYHTYSSSASSWEIEKQIFTMAQHITDTQQKCAGSNSMWKAFGLAGMDDRAAAKLDTSNDMAIIRKELEFLRKLHVGSSPGRVPARVHAQ